ncbi:hypothetical protein ASE01_09425 [Nocardioides sp. Root190]|uniref:hypothetical protein n=1 Tax=Nocardioides sp. Root190 TaxID=1736488 RepID=UPI0006F590DA|nr:hypothetical protein [Nocardioides sp. Root190]KRB76977.1 hypothetical protein ASE01_09425 [Nocardioides sp. Root190]
MTDQLRNLLHQAVPDDAPALDAHHVAGAARRARRRVRTAAAGGAVAVILAGAVTTAVLTSGEEDRTARDPGLDPYGAPACPATLPDLMEAETSIGSLDGVASVRLCPDFAAYGEAPPAAEQSALLDSMDALVGDLDDFADRVAATEPFDSMRCAAISVMPSRQSLQFTFDDGRTLLLPTMTCSPIEVAGRAVDGQYLGEAYLAALGAQRESNPSTRAYDGPLDCSPVFMATPARPGREQIVAAVGCRGDEPPVELTGAALERLQEAWSNPRPVQTCTLIDYGVRVVAATDRGDVVTLSGNGCQTFDWSATSPENSFDVPVTYADLGLTP